MIIESNWLELFPGNFLLVKSENKIVKSREITENSVTDTEGNTWNMSDISGIPATSENLDKFSFIKSDAAIPSYWIDGEDFTVVPNDGVMNPVAFLDIYDKTYNIHTNLIIHYIHEIQNEVKKYLNRTTDVLLTLAE